MTTHYSATSENAPESFDTGSLSWVMAEIRETLSRTRSAVQEAVSQEPEAQSTSLRHAKMHLHQAHGALQVVDVDGVSIITETIEDLLDHLETGKISLSSQVVQAITSGCDAVAEYLEELLAGEPHQPVRLFPYYRALLESRGAERIHPADLFFPNLSLRPQFEAWHALPVQYRELRQRYEQALLPFLKSNDPASERSHAAAMAQIVGQIELAQDTQQMRAFWWVMRVFAEGVAGGAIRNEVYVKQLFARINLQIRRIVAGVPGSAERLLRDGLFFIAQAVDPSADMQQVRKAYQLTEQAPVNYHEKRYGQIDLNALAAAKEHVAQAKCLWSRIADGDAGAAAEFERKMQAAAEAGSLLNIEPLSNLLRKLNGIARHAARTGSTGNLGIELAAGLLFAENALNHINRLGDDFPRQVEVLTARLLAVASGEEPAEAAPWLSTVSRDALQEQTVTALVTEMMSGLGKIERALDEYFASPSNHAVLQPVDFLLHQLEGAMVILDQEQAAKALQHVRHAVQKLTQTDAAAPPDQRLLPKLAQNIGALSFFIESLRQNLGRAREQFSFNEQLGVFQANVIEKKNGDGPRADVQNSAEGEVRAAQETAWRSAVSNFAQLADMEPSQSARNLAAVEEKSLDNTGASGSQQVVTAQGDGTAPGYGSVSTDDLLAGISLDPPGGFSEPFDRQTSSPEIGANPGTELAEEADDDQLNQQLKDWLTAADLDESLNYFKPSEEQEMDGGSMPTLSSPAPASPGSAAPAVPSENLGNAVADPEQLAIDSELLEIFLLEAVEVLDCARETILQLRQEPHENEHMTTARRCFHTLKGSGRMVGLSDFGNAAWSIEKVLNARLSEGKEASPELYALLNEAVLLLDAWVDDLQSKGWSDRKADFLIAAAEQVGKGQPFPARESDAAMRKEGPASAVIVNGSPNVAQNPDFAADADSAQSEETPAQVRSPSEFERRKPAPGDAAAPSQQSSLDDRAESYMTTRLPPLTDGLPLSNVIDFPEPAPSEPRHDDTVKRIGNLRISVPLHNIYTAETDELVRLLSVDLAEWRHESHRPVNNVAVHAAHSLTGSSATVGFVALQELAHALETVLQTLARTPVPLDEQDFDTLDDVIQCIKVMLQRFALCEMPPAQTEQLRKLQELRQRIAERAAKNNVHAAPATRDAGNPRTTGPELPGRATGAQTTEEPPVAELVPMMNLKLSLPKDEIDIDLLPVFIEEAHDMLPQMQQLLREWHKNPSERNSAQSLLRLLHTVKGSARMAGAMALGQHMHDLETRIQQMTRDGIMVREDIEDLIAEMDAGMHLFEMVQRAHSGRSSPDVSLSTAATLPEEIQVPGTAQPRSNATVPAKAAPVADPMVPAGAGAAQLVRVRSDVLDRLLNQAGEVSIARSKIETEVGALRQSLTELTDNVARLRGHLREMEIQAETQMASHMAQSTDRDFDPLEFDRFTRLQELTRIMAENVNDVASLQQNLARTVDVTVDDLTAQARMTRDLQQDLMRVRMVQFGSVAERLYRVTRQAAKETGKRVNLEIRGGAVEIDRSVLEKMVGPFEHLLRNAIVHGIESRDARIAAGKTETGEITVDVQQDGNEILIRFSDDGQGLNFNRIRAKAKELGLLADKVDISDGDVQDLIFHPGFSTAREVTELAGRGVGLDVVRAETTAVGGRIGVLSEPGKGAQFVIRLPMSMAVTQVVLLAAGGKTYAVPSVLVEQVQQLRPKALAAAYNEGAVVWQGSRTPLHFLSALLGEVTATPISQEYSPLVVLRSGEHRVALHVDEVIGNREVVLKNIGPQLARMIGIAGATVTGSGDIVLILNPVPLAYQSMQEAMRAPRMLSTPISRQLGAVAEMVPAPSREPVSQPVQGLRTQNIVMVVDDSLTVRRVTQRFLAREGYQVVLAKDGIDALEQLQSVTPDVMLVDIEMPRMDGFDLTRNVRGAPRTVAIPIIMITSRTAEKHRNYARELGVNEYLGKPYNEDELLQLIKGFVRQKAELG